MKLSQLFEALSYGELSQLAIGGSGSGVVPEEHYSALITHTNSGLTKLYSRFPLAEKELVIEQQEGITTYHLKSAFAQSNTDSTEPVKYIKDSVDEPFLEDIIRLEMAYDVAGEEVPLDDRNAEVSWFTPSFNKLKIKEPVQGELSTLVYRANHPRISTDETDLGSVDVEIPSYLEEALQCYIASRVHSLRSTPEAMSESSLYYSKFSAICTEVENRNLTLNSQNVTNDKLDAKGYA